VFCFHIVAWPIIRSIVKLFKFCLQIVLLVFWSPLEPFPPHDILGNDVTKQAHEHELANMSM
jgi:hypothetical protein